MVTWLLESTLRIVGKFKMILDKCAGLCYHNAYRVVAGVVELVDTGDLKSPGSNAVPVQVRSPAPHLIYRGVEQLVARRAHNPEVAGSSPVSATIKQPVLIQNRLFL